MTIKDLIQQNNHKHLGAQMSSDAAFRIYLVQLGLQVAGIGFGLLERGVGALEAIAKLGGAKLPSEADLKARRQAEAKAKLAELERQKAELEKAAAEDGEDEG